MSKYDKIIIELESGNKQEMSKGNIQEKSFNFAVRIIKLCKFLRERGGTGYDISKQLIRCGTSVGANIQEAQSPESKADFVHKMNIGLKEARESNYWIKLLIATEEDLEPRLIPLLNESNEIIAIIHTIIKNTKSNS